MSVPHDMLRDDLPAYALGTLDPQASARLQRHLSECDECVQVLREYEDVMRLLPFGLPHAEPSPAARRELLRRVRTDQASSQRRVGAGWWPHVRLHALTALVVVAAVIGGALFWSLSGGDDGDDAAETVADLRTDSETQIIPLLGSVAAPRAVAQLFFQPGEMRAGLVVSGLPPLPDDRTYQLWFVQPDETRHDGGIFDVDTDGQAIVAIAAPADYAPGWTCGVTEEPAGGSISPTGQNVLRGSYEDYDW